jgi:hypothetical protein
MSGAPPVNFKSRRLFSFNPAWRTGARADRHCGNAAVNPSDSSVPVGMSAPIAGNRAELDQGVFPNVS